MKIKIKFNSKIKYKIKLTFMAVDGTSAMIKAKVKDNVSKKVKAKRNVDVEL